MARLQNVRNQLLAYFTRGRRAAGQIGVFATPEGVAAAQVIAGRRRQAAPDALRLRERGRAGSVRARAEPLAEPARAHGQRARSRGYRLLLVEAPDVPADELRAAVRWRIKDLIDFHIDDAVIDVFEMPPHARGGPQRMMYAVTAKAEVVKREIERIESAGLKLGVVDIPELSLRNIATLLESGSRRRVPLLERPAQHAAARAPGRALSRAPHRDRRGARSRTSASCVPSSSPA